MPPRVFLTGFMGSGKSTVGPLLADHLGYRFVDLDWLVEAQTGRSIADLFAEGGEAAFRTAEAAALAESTKGDRLVIATGGGALVDPANLETARAAGPVVWLRASVPVLVTRLADASGRPLLAGPDGAPLHGSALAERVRDLLRRREPAYARASVIVDADGPPGAVALRVADALQRWTRRAGGAGP